MLQTETKALLVSDGILLTPEAAQALARYLELLREWNPFAALVSKGDLDRIEEIHLPDCLSLAAPVRAACGQSGALLDIGSGGGLPAIPIKIVLPRLPITLVERSERKIGFLRKVLGVLKLENANLIHGDFPAAAKEVHPAAVTARAVERPERLLKCILKNLPADAVFLCQSSKPPAELPDRFHVERVEDAWRNAGLRRGELYLIRRVS